MPQVKINALSYAQLIKYLTLGCYTIPQLAEHTGLHYRTICDHVNALHKAGVIHISYWAKDSKGRDALRVYDFGPGADAPRRKLTQQQRQKIHRSRKKLAQLLRLRDIPSAMPAL